MSCEPRRFGPIRRALSIERLEQRELLSVTPTDTASSTSTSGSAQPAWLQAFNQASATGGLSAGISAALTAAQAATTQSAVSSQYNVTDPQFGAVGDGVTDDSVAIQAAIDAAAAAGGGVVYFPQGNYVAQNLQLPERVFIQGSGQGVSTVELPANATANLFNAVPDNSGQFTDGGFSSISLSGQGPSGQRNTQFDGISFANVPVSTNQFQVSRVDIVGFRNGFYGTNDFGTFMINCYIGNNVNGIVDFENPFIINCRINGNTIGLSGRLADALMVENYFSSNLVGAEPQFGHPFRQTTFTGNVFTGNSYIDLVIDDQNTVTGNVFEGSLTSTPALMGILVRGNGNAISGNKIGLESPSPTVTSQDFAYGGVVFNAFDYTGALITGGSPGTIGATGTNTVIANNVITAQSGAGIAVSGPINLIGVNITNNSFDLWGQSGILYNNPSPYNAWGDRISNNSFILKTNTTCPAVSIGGSGGNNFNANQFIVDGGGVQTSYMVTINAATTIFTNNQAINLPLNQNAWNFTGTDANTVIANNLATDSNGQAVQVSQASGQVIIAPAIKSINVTYGTTSLIRAPTASDISIAFASNPYNASVIWITNVTSTGFTINLNNAPGQGSTAIAWKLLLT